jgi:hypothetical protein
MARLRFLPGNTFLCTSMILTTGIPAYSPDLSPIEPAFSKIKQVLRRAKAQSVAALLDTNAQPWMPFLGRCMVEKPYLG